METAYVDEGKIHCEQMIVQLESQREQKLV